MNAQNFPIVCIGAIYGKHIRVVKSEHSGALLCITTDMYQYFLNGICNASFTFILIEVGAYGDSSD